MAELNPLRLENKKKKSKFLILPSGGETRKSGDLFIFDDDKTYSHKKVV